MDTFYKVLEELRNKPALYLYSISLTNLEIFILGYSTALHAHNLSGNKNDFDFDDFTSWIHDKYQDVPRNQNWAFAIRAKYSDEEKAFLKFFELYDEYNTQTTMGEETS